MTTWKIIPGFESYMASDEGQIKSLLSGKVLRPAADRGGYLHVGIRKGHKSYTRKVHRLVALTFLPQTGPMINHKNEIKTDNRACNLEWCDRVYNANYGTVRERIRRTLGKRVLQITPNGEVVGVFDSMQDAAAKTGVNYRHIQSLCNNKEQSRKTAGGFCWKYEE